MFDDVVDGLATAVREREDRLHAAAGRWGGPALGALALAAGAAGVAAGRGPVGQRAEIAGAVAVALLAAAAVTGRLLRARPAGVVLGVAAVGWAALGGWLAADAIVHTAEHPESAATLWAGAAALLATAAGAAAVGGTSPAPATRVTGITGTTGAAATTTATTTAGAAGAAGTTGTPGTAGSTGALPHLSPTGTAVLDEPAGGGGLEPFAATTVAAAGTVVAGAAGVAGHLAVSQSAVIASVLGLAFVLAIPMLAFRLAGQRLPALPATAERIQVDLPPGSRPSCGGRRRSWTG
ncbi:hypothetical protein ACFQ9X_01000 [Catenulispora yoronensis]